MNRILFVSLALFLYLAAFDTAAFAVNSEIDTAIAQKDEGVDGNSASLESTDSSKNWDRVFGVLGVLFGVFGVLLTVISLIWAVCQSRKASAAQKEIKELQETSAKKIAELDKKLKQNRTYGQQAIEDDIKDVCGKIVTRDGFEPELIFAPAMRSAPGAYLFEKYLKNHLERPIPILFGLCFFREEIKLDEESLKEQGYTFSRDKDKTVFLETESGKKEESAYVDEQIQKKFPKAFPSFEFIGITGKWAMYVSHYTEIDPDTKVLIVDDFCDGGTTIEKLNDHFVQSIGIKSENVKTTCLVTRKHARTKPDYVLAKDQQDDIKYLPWGKIR